MSRKSTRGPLLRARLAAGSRKGPRGGVQCDAAGCDETRDVVVDKDGLADSSKRVERGRSEVRVYLHFIWGKECGNAR